MTAKRRREVVYVVKGETNGEPKPTAFLEVNAAGRLVYGVRAHARSLAAARETVQEEFRKLERFARDATQRALAASVEKT